MIREDYEVLVNDYQFKPTRHGINGDGLPIYLIGKIEGMKVIMKNIRNDQYFIHVLVEKNGDHVVDPGCGRIKKYDNIRSIEQLLDAA